MNYFCSIFCFLILGWTSLVPEFSFAARSEKMSGEKTPEDASDITWAHAVNSRDALEQYLASSVNFLEADVSLGHVIGKAGVIPIPVMSHPPSKISDISLDQWLDTVTSRGSDKGIKLDFKSTEVVEPSLIILKRYASKLNSSVWLNADVLPGPVNSKSEPVNVNEFLAQCRLYFPEATLSMGWATYWFPTVTAPDTWHYDWQHVRAMVDAIRCSGYKSSLPKITFPVRGIFASRSVRVLKWLLAAVPGSSLTVWTGKYDPLEVQDLLRIRSSFPKDKVYYDVPKNLNEEFSEKKNSSAVGKSVMNGDDGRWMVLTRGHGESCSSLSYISGDTVVFGKSLTTAVLRKDLLMFRRNSDIKIKGLVKFFGADGDHASPETMQELILVLVDVSLFAKSTPSTELDLTTSDTEVLWSAINSSVIFTFQHSANKQTSCRAFKLDATADKSFEVWTVPCNTMLEEVSFDEIAKAGVPEISSRKRLVLPEGPLMFGLVSKGEEHVVVHDLSIEGAEGTYTSGSKPSRINITKLPLSLLAQCFFLLF